MKRSILSLLCVLCFPLFAHAELSLSIIDVHVYQLANKKVVVSIVSGERKRQCSAASIAEAVEILEKANNNRKNITFVRITFEDAALAKKSLPLCQAVLKSQRPMMSFCVKSTGRFFGLPKEKTRNGNLNSTTKKIAIPKNTSHLKPHEYHEVNLTAPEKNGPHNLRKIQVIQRTPLFDNAPFLRLKKGDQFLKAEQKRNNKLGGNGYSNAYFIFSRGTFYRIDAREEKGTLKLRSPKQCLLFNWNDVTIPNGTAIKKLCDLKGIIHNEISQAEYQKVAKLMSKAFPKTHCFTTPHCMIHKTKTVSINSGKCVVFEGIAYNTGWHNRLYKYRLTIGPSVFRCTKTVLIIGPKEISQDDFLGKRICNQRQQKAFRPKEYKSPPVKRYKVSPKIAKQKRQEYDEMVKFKLLVAGVIRPQCLPDMKKEFHVPPLKTTEK